MRCAALPMHESFATYVLNALGFRYTALLLFSISLVGPMVAMILMIPRYALAALGGLIRGFRDTV